MTYRLDLARTAVSLLAAFTVAAAMVAAAVPLAPIA